MNIMIVVVLVGGGREVLLCALCLNCELLMDHTKSTIDKRHSRNRLNTCCCSRHIHLKLPNTRTHFIEANVAWPYSLLQWL